MRKWKRILLVSSLAVMLVFSFLPLNASAEEQEPMDMFPEMKDALLSQYDFNEIDRSLKEMFPEEQLAFKETLMGLLSGDLTFSVGLLGRLVKDQLGYAFRSSRDNLIHMLIIALLAAVFSNFSKVFQSRQISDISFYALYLLLIALAISSFEAVADWVRGGIEALTAFMGVFCPLYFLAVSIARGSATSVAFYHLVLFLIFLTEVLILDFLLPLLHHTISHKC